jgi:hypothetical protein
MKEAKDVIKTKSNPFLRIDTSENLVTFRIDRRPLKMKWFC